MTLSYDLVIVAGDSAYNITITLQNSDTTIKDLTGYTAAKLKVWTSEGAVDFLNKTISILSPTVNGQVQYTVGNTDFPLSSIGWYYFSIVLTNPAGGTETTLRPDNQPYTLLVALAPPV